MGPLKSPAAQQLAGLAAVEIGEADIEQHEIDMAAPRLLQAFRRGRREQCVEFLVQAELLAQDSRSSSSSSMMRILRALLIGGPLGLIPR